MTGPPSPPLRLGTRGSPLALAQAQLVAQSLAQAGGPAVDTVVIQTSGDRIQDRRLAEIGGKALWTRELDAALLDGRIDAGVHSMKDVETRLADGIVLAAVLSRADPRDRLIGADSLAALPAGARVGTSSPRREAQLRHLRPDLSCVLLRGNVATRLARVADGTVDATFLAAAGLDRLGIDAGVPLPLHAWLPAAAQGIVGITVRAGSAPLALLAAIDHPPTHVALLAERALLAALGGGCRTAVAAHACAEGGTLHLAAQMFSPDGRESVAAEARASFDPQGAAQAAAEVAQTLLAAATRAMRQSLEPGTP